LITVSPSLIRRAVSATAGNHCTGPDVPVVSVAQSEKTVTNHITHMPISIA
jgi:hypothetical protein